MTAAPASPQQMKDRLLQAIDPQSNIRNMVAVLDVISSLERFPITKEALEETRLGKLINDVRKKTQNEELARRAKKLLRSWQKLIEPAPQAEAAMRGLAGAPGSANGGAHNCRPDLGAASTAKGLHDLRGRNDIQRLPGPRLDRLATRKRRGDQRDLGLPGAPAKVSKASHDPLVPNSSPLPTNGIGGSPESCAGPLDGSRHLGPEVSRLEAGEGEPAGSKIPVNAVRPHTSSPALGQPPGPCLQPKGALQLDRLDLHSGLPHPKGLPRCSISPRNSRHEGSGRQRSPYMPKGRLSSPALRPQVPDALSQLPATQPPTPPVRRLELLPNAESPVRCLEHPEGHPRLPPPTAAEPVMSRAGFSPDYSKVDSDAASSCGGGRSDSRKKKRYRPRDYTVNLDGQGTEAVLKPSVRLKERKLTFDHMTRQIRPLTQKEPARADSPVSPEPPCAEPAGSEAKGTLQSPFEQTNWKELSRNEMIQTYLNRQSTLLSSSGAQTPGAHHFMAEYLRQEESARRHARQPHVLEPAPGPPTHLPGLTRDVTQEDVERLQGHPWPGVNGCRDTQGNWYDWTQCIVLDPHGDEGGLNILPYVCLD